MSYPSTKETEPCEICAGQGFVAYFNNEGEEITREEWEKLPAWEREEDMCTTCDGTGQIQYEPEYEHENED